MDLLAQAQGGFVTEEDPLAEILEIALDRLKGTLKTQPVQELYVRLQEIVEGEDIAWDTESVAALTKALKNRRTALEQRLGARIVLTSNHHGGEYRVSIQRLPSSDAAASGQRGGVGGNGGDREEPFLVELSASCNSEKKERRSA